MSSAALPPLAPPPYLTSIVQYLRAHEAEAWAAYGSDAVRREHAEQVRIDLLKSTLRLEPQAARIERLIG